MSAATQLKKIQTPEPTHKPVSKRQYIDSEQFYPEPNYIRIKYTNARGEALHLYFRCPTLQECWADKRAIHRRSWSTALLKSKKSLFIKLSIGPPTALQVALITKKIYQERFPLSLQILEIYSQRISRARTRMKKWMRNSLF